MAATLLQLFLALHLWVLIGAAAAARHLPSDILAAWVNPGPVPMHRRGRAGPGWPSTSPISRTAAVEGKDDGGGIIDGGWVGTGISKADAARIQSEEAKAGHNTGKGSLAAQAQSAAKRNERLEGELHRLEGHIRMTRVAREEAEHQCIRMADEEWELEKLEDKYDDFDDGYDDYDREGHESWSDY